MSRAHISESKTCFNVKTLTSYMKTKILGDFEMVKEPKKFKKYRTL